MSYHQHPTKGPGWWHIYHRPDGHKGKQRTITFEGSEEEARELDVSLKQAPKSKKYPVIFPKISDTIDEYIRHYSLEHLDTTNITRSLRRWSRYVGQLRFNEVTEVILERYKHDRLDIGIKPTTINKELSALRGLLKWGKKKGYCAAVPEFERFGAKKTRAPLPDVPTREEVLALINSMIWPRCGFFACLYFGGLRAGEAKGLRREDVHLDRRLMIVTGKGNKQRVVPIVNELVPWLEKRLPEVSPGALVWTSARGHAMSDLDKMIDFAKVRAGISRRIYPHLLRHAFGTHSTMAGVGLRALQTAMGHTSSHTTELYTTLGHNAIIDEITGKFGVGV
jgi:site-specific recombinase XerD